MKRRLQNHKLTPEAEKRILEAARRGGSQSEAAKAGGVHYNTIARWLDMGRVEAKQGRHTQLTRFAEAWDQAREECLSTLDAIEWDIATSDEQPSGARLKAVEMVRARVTKSTPTIRVEHTGTVTHEHSAPTLSDVELRLATDEQLERLLSEIRRGPEVLGESDA